MQVLKHLAQFVCLCVSGVVLSVIRACWCPVCVSAGILWLLRAERTSSSARRVPPPPQSDHQRLWWGISHTQSCTSTQTARLMFNKFVFAAAGGMLLPGSGEDKNHRQLLHGSLWPLTWRTGESCSYITSLCDMLVCDGVCVYVQECEDGWSHLSELMLFALAMQESLKHINIQTGNRFQLRVGS